MRGWSSVGRGRVMRRRGIMRRGAAVFRSMGGRSTVACRRMLTALESTRMAAIGRRSMTGRYTRTTEVTAARCRIVTRYRRASHRISWRHTARTGSQRGMTTQPSLPGPRDSTRSSPRCSGMIERVAPESAPVRKFAPHRMASGETASPDHVDRPGIVSEREVHRRSAPYPGDDPRREDGAA